MSRLYKLAVLMHSCQKISCNSSNYRDFVATAINTLYEICVPVDHDPVVQSIVSVRKLLDED